MRAHAEFCVGLGFNAIWIYSYDAGRWDESAAPRGPFLDPAFRTLAAWCRERGVRMIVSVNPPADAGGGFVFHTRDGERRIVTFLRLLRRAGVRDFVLSFDDQPVLLSDLGDVVRYGFVAAPAHLDLTRRIERRIRRGERLWLCATAHCDLHLGDGLGPYSSAFLAGLPTLPRRVGIVWTGRFPISPAIGADELRASRERLGGREVLLYDNYAAIEGGGNAIAAYLGPLRERDPRLAEIASVYMACPLYGPGASRMSLLTVADWLADPSRYQAEESRDRAIERLAGDDRGAADALRIQALEWRGWDGGQRFRPWDPVDPVEAAESLDDPAISASWGWTVARYPERMAALSNLADPAFGDSLIEVMSRRLAIARAVPPALEYRARVRAGRTDLAPVIEELRAARSAASSIPSALRALDGFLDAAGIPAP